MAILVMPQGKVFRHLPFLRNAQLVSDRRDGTWIYYSLSPAYTVLERFLHAYLHEREDLTQIDKDRARLTGLEDQGKVCVPQSALQDI